MKKLANFVCGFFFFNINFKGNKKMHASRIYVTPRSQLSDLTYVKLDIVVIHNLGQSCSL